MIEGDSAEYEYLTHGVELSKDVNGICIELGVRRGMGTKTIMDAVHTYCRAKKVVAVDPYGSIPYTHREGQVVRLDYTNDMRTECMIDLFNYSKQIGVGFYPFTLTDTDFFEINKNGIIFYELEREIVNKYSFVHLDAGHSVIEALNQFKFFNERMDSGATMAFDDITDDFYPHDRLVEPVILQFGWELLKKGNKKALYRKS